MEINQDQIHDIFAVMLPFSMQEEAMYNSKNQSKENLQQTNIFLN